MATLLTQAHLGQTSDRKKSGLLGKDREILRDLFIDEKTPRQFDKLTGLQKKVIRKMGWDKSIFIKNDRSILYKERLEKLTPYIDYIEIDRLTIDTSEEEFQNTLKLAIKAEKYKAKKEIEKI